MDENQIEIGVQFAKVAKGTGVVLLGSLSGTLLGFVSKIIVVRYISKAEFGLLSLSLVIINILVTLSLMGFASSIPRYISHALGQKEYSRAWSGIRFSIEIVLFFSVFFSLFLFVFSQWFSMLFQKPGLSEVIDILLFTIPLTAGTALSVSILAGFEDVKFKAYFQDILQPVIRIFMIGLVIFFGLRFKGVVFVQLISILFIFLALSICAKKRIESIIPVGRRTYMPVRRKLMMFSLPLLVSNLSSVVLSWTNTLMLGYFETTTVVGLYSVALPIAGFVPIILTSMTLIYLPVASRLHSQEKVEVMKRLYASLTKWSFFATLPFVLCLLVFSKSILELLYGTRYSGANIALQVLAVGYALHVFLGPNGMTLISIGKTKTVTFCALSGALSNILLCLILIPIYRLTGAAIAATFSLGLTNALLSILLFRTSGIHAFEKRFLLAIFVSLLVTLVPFKLIISPVLYKDWYTVPLGMVIVLICIGSVVMLRSINKEDVYIIRVLEERTIKNTRITDKLLKAVPDAEIATMRRKM